MRSPAIPGHALAALTVAATILAGGCGSTRTLPSAPTSGSGASADAAFSIGLGDPRSPTKGPFTGLSDRYPLASGNRWTYERLFVVNVVDAQGNVVSTYGDPTSIERLQTCPVTIGGREYLTERVTTSDGYNISRYWVRFRDDARGLYEADQIGPDPSCAGAEAASTSPVTDQNADLGAAWSRAIDGVRDPEQRAAFERAWEAVRGRIEAMRIARIPAALGLRPRFNPLAGPPDGEIQRLRYPLLSGQSWVIRQAPRFTAGVEARESILLPAGRYEGWRIRYDSDIFGPADRVYVWYGADGCLRQAFHTEGVATDQSGRPIGKVFADELIQLADLQLVEPAGRPFAGP
jgi:hypothetical protein